MSEFKYMKFRVENEEHSKQIQEALFKLGYKWNNGKQNTIDTEEPYLFTYDNGRIYYGIYESVFQDFQHTEYKLINGEIIKATEEDKEVDTIQLTYAEAWEKLKEGKEVFYSGCVCRLNSVNNTIMFKTDTLTELCAPFHPTNTLFTMKKEPEYEILGLHDDLVEVEVFGVTCYLAKGSKVIYSLASDGRIFDDSDEYLVVRVKFKGNHRKAKIKVTVDKDGNVTYEHL